MFHQPFHVGPRRLRFFDLDVYRAAGVLVLHGHAVYGGPILHGFSFTYPPFAALAFTPLALLPPGVDAALVTAANALALLVIVRLALALVDRTRSGVRSGTPRPSVHAWAIAAVAASAALWLEPISTTIGYGQIDLLITLLILVDLTRQRTSKTHGLWIGIAAGLKLTPLIFIPYLLLSGRRRAAATVTATFAATVAAGAALLPADSLRYWSGEAFDPSRVGFPADASNQSLQGALARLAHAATSGSTSWLLAAAALATIGLAAAVLAARRGDDATGFQLTALTALLVSPISWTHHWALALPVLVIFAIRPGRRTALRRAATLAIAVAAFSYLPERIDPDQAVHAGGLLELAADPYVLIGLVALLTGSSSQLRQGPWKGGRMDDVPGARWRPKLAAGG